MTLSEPIAFEDALKSQDVKRLLRTTLTSKELQQIPAALRERARFSAQVTTARILEGIDRGIRDMLEPKMVDQEGGRVVKGLDEATMRMNLKDMLRGLDYSAPEGKAGTIEDLGSDARLNLIIQTNADLARGYGQREAGMTEATLDEWPCQELRRAETREVPRGTDEGIPDEYWQTKWEDLGGTLYGGRMICAKDDPIAEEISDFGLPYGPPGFGSGYEWFDIDRDTAVELGVLDKEGEPIGRDTQVEPESRDFNEDLQSSLTEMDDGMQRALLDALNRNGKEYEFDDDGVLRRIGDKANEGTSEGAVKGWEARKGSQPEDFGMRKMGGSLGRMGYHGSSDPSVVLSAQLSPKAIFITRLDAVAQGKGSGSAAINRIKGFAEATGRRVELTARADTPELQGRLNSFYERHGFTKTDYAEHPSYVWSPSSNRLANEIGIALVRLGRLGVSPHTPQAALTAPTHTTRTH